MTAPLRIAIVGSGPAGMYAAEHASKLAPGSHITIFERLLFPYGLVRYGVAPDHHRMKAVTRLYERVLDTPNVHLRLGVEIGLHVSVPELLEAFDAIVFAYGAAHDKTLNIPGETLPGSYSATEFVAWYNAHPEFVDASPDVSTTAAVVVGLGNVAIDVARILAKSTQELAESDIADHALTHLEQSRIEDIYIVGRRGPAEAKFTTKELRELGELANADIVVDGNQLDLHPLQEEYLETDFNAKKNVEVLQAMADTPLTGKPRRLHIRFYESPVALTGNERVAGVKLAANTLVQQNGSLRVHTTDRTHVLPAGLVLRSVGYRGAGLAGVPFDDARGVIPNIAGRVLSGADSSVVPRMYAAGWIKRGPSGVIGTNRADALETIQSLVEDFPSERVPERVKLRTTPAAIDALIMERGAQWLDQAAWREIDAHELALGEEHGRPRVKLIDRDAVNLLLTRK